MPDPNDYKLYRYVDNPSGYAEDECPKGIDYKSGLNTNLHPRRTFYKGELQQVEWFAAYDGTNYTDPIINVTITYVRDILGFALSRTTTREWYRENGIKSSDALVTTKYYSDPVSRHYEGVRRRSNHILYLKEAVIGLMLESGVDPNPAVVVQLGRDFLEAYKIQISAFEQDSQSSFRNAVIADTTHTWLDSMPASLGGSLSIRDWVAGQLDLTT